MKILKAGKAERRKFVCKKCGCIFVCNTTDDIAYREPSGDYSIYCPVCRLPYFTWDSGEPYEEPTPTQTDRERLDGIICDLLNREYISRECIVEHLIAHGVTFGEG